MKNRHSRSEHLAALAEISGAFASTLNIEETLNHGLTRIREFMGVEAVSIFLTDTATGELVCRACAGGTDITGVRMQPGQGIVGEAAEADQPLMVRDVYDDARFSPVVDEMTGFVSRSIMAAPLVVDTLRLGAIEVVNPSGGDGLFQESDRATLSLLATAVALSINNARLAAELVDQARIRHELALASEIQKELLPRSPGELFPVHALNYPAHEVSGDLYDFQQLPDGGIAFCLADVSGKGINAALLGMKVSTLIHHLARECDDPAKLLTRVNDVLVEGRRRGMFVTALAGYLSADQRQVRLANAGHPPPVLRRGLEARAVTAASGPPLGVVQDPVYESESHAIDGGQLLIYSDGLSEARNAMGDELGVDGVRNRVAQMPDTGASGRLRWLLEVALKPDSERRDDISVMLVQGAVLEHFNLRMEAEAASLASMRASLRHALAEMNLPSDTVQDAVLAANEACMNVIQHGYAGKGGPMELTAYKQRGVLEIEIRDWADEVNLAAVRSRDLQDVRPGGLGVHFMETLMDQVRYEPVHGRGNLLIMRKQL